MRRLFYVPILHTEREVSLIQSGEGHGEKVRSIQEMWAGLQKKLLDLALPWEKVRIYQDALPVCGREEEIVRQLALKGSMNHRLLLGFMKRGARLEGTEDPGLLLKEYDLLSQAFSGSSDASHATPYRAQSDALLAERDQFIVRRVQETLQDGETVLLFMGVRHKIEPLLKKDYELTYVIYRLPFQTIKTVYNL
ncbi:MAG: hypothetical protein HYU97_08115 [Deltaproteobacteria bacterium]|nr:hypothetical protein [Deltaproteobacteria bacterium]